MANDNTSKKGLITAAEINDKFVDASRFQTPLREGRHLKNRRDW